MDVRNANARPGWYGLIERGSVRRLTLFASLQHIGTPTAPMRSIMRDRIGYRDMLCGKRALYAMLPCTLMSHAFAGVPAPVRAR